MRLSFLIGFGMFFISTTAFGESVWVQVASSSSHIFSAKKGSFEISKTQAGIPIGLVRAQIHVKKTNENNYAQWYVTKSDCLDGMGKLVELDTSGDFNLESDFIAGGDSVSGGIADLICGLYKDQLDEQHDKSV